MTFPDLDFQNGRDTLRVAPWLDMPLLRDALQNFFRAALEGPHGFLLGYQGAYKEDMLEFCDGKRSRIPNCPAVRDVAINVMGDTFPTSNTDQNRSAAINHIFGNIMQRRMWSRGNRGSEDPVTASAPTAKIKVDEEWTYDDEEEDCGGCGDCDMCDQF